jgi:hypothetical protein
MLARIYWECKNGTEDSALIEADTIHELREKAIEIVSIRGGQNPWSEIIEENENDPA